MTRRWLTAAIFLATLSAPLPAAAAAIGVAWNPVADSTVLRYVLSYGTRSGSYTSSVDTGLATQWFVTNVADGTRLYFVVQACNIAGCSARSAEVNGVTFTPIPLISADFSGDRRTEISVWRPGAGTWYTRISDGNFSGTSYFNWGAGALNDVPVVGDYDGDGFGDAAVWRPANGRWYVRYKSGGSTDYAWGSGGLQDVPVPADYDGDGRTDYAVWRPSIGTWFIQRSSNSTPITYTWGSLAMNDVPLPGDYDGDGRADLGIWRPGTGAWHILLSSSSYTRALSSTWGSAAYGDVPVPGDFDGDGRTDIAVWRPGSTVTIWYIRTSSSQFTTHVERAWGSGLWSDVPVVGDFDGDRRADPTVWRPSTGTWYILRSTSGLSSFDAIAWGAGAAGDIPIGSPRAR